MVGRSLRLGLSGLAAAALLATGCTSGSADDASPTATIARRTPTSTTTTTVAGDENFESILRDLLAKRDEAYEKNDISILESIYSPQCECLAKGREAIRAQIAEGVHVGGERLKLIGAEVIDRSGSEYVAVRTTVEQGPYRYLTASGAVARLGTPTAPHSVVYELSKHDDVWWILGITPR